MSVAEMGISLFAATEGYLTDVPVNRVLDFEQGLLGYMNSQHGDFMKMINETGAYNDEIVAQMKQAIEAYKATASF
jgi:F-type H+-transporting ATPase subunit alpha